MELELSGKVAVVVGVSSAIGQAIALGLSNEGCHVVGTTRRDYLSREGDNILMDLESDTSVMRGFSEVRKRHPAVHILVNAAGLNWNAKAGAVTISELVRIFKVNFTGPLLCAQEVLPKMREVHYGRIINISSIVGETGAYGAGMYASSKAALNALTKSLAKEEGKAGITANAIALGYTSTGMIRDVPPAIVERIVQSTPMRRLGTPLDVAGLVVYLCKAPWMTGQVIRLDGGYPV